MFERQGDAGAAPSGELVARIAAGDRDAEADFVRRYQRGVTALVRRHCRPNEPDVADLVQEVLASVLQRLRAGAVREADSLAAYLQVTVARLTAAEYRRRAGRDAVHASMQDEAGEPVAQIEDIDRARCSRAVRELITQLPTPRDREILRLFYLEEASKAEVCSTLGIDPEHFRRVIFRARQRLRELLEREGVGRGETRGRLETPA